MSEPVAIVHDYLTQRGGAERVVLALTRAFPSAPLYTSVYLPEGTFPEFADRAVRSTGLNRIPHLRRHHRLDLAFLAAAFSRLIVESEVVICSSSGWAHGATVKGRKLVYCYTPARWLYQRDRYLGRGSPLRRMTLAALRPSLERWDRRAAASAHRYLAISSAVQERIRRAYGIESDILHPPHSMDPSAQVEALDLEPGFLLTVSRLLPYKNLDAVLEAMASLPTRRLVIVGRGPLAGPLRAKAARNLTLLGAVSDAQLRWLYANCAGLVAASHEDFGLTPLEAAAFGKPSAVLRWGGFLDTVVEGETGIFFSAPEPVLIRQAVEALDRHDWAPERLRAQAERFSEERFVAALQQVVADERAQV